ncbi:hypothetical protein ACQ856_30210 (plasmid) [Mycolicibacterium psychrotolerans]|uniref:hypothetical protein n=1 Tax=Mycolicibacterium psychrotolerans TaxID=216929 RepID=UPI003D67E6C2
MTNRTAAVAAAILVSLPGYLAGCSTTAGTPQSSPTAGSGTVTNTSDSTPMPSTPSASPSTAAAPSGPPVGTATMQILGTGAGPVTIRYQINDGPEQVEPNVTLPWSKDYPVYDKLTSSITAEGAGDSVLTCSIIMDGKLLAFRSEPNAKCTFAYWG